MSSQFPRRSTSLRVLTSLVGILSIGSLFSLPAFSQSNDSPSDSHTLPRGTTDAPLPTTGDSQNIYPVNRDETAPAQMNQDGTVMPNSNSQGDLNSPARTNQDGTVMPNSNNQRNLNSPSQTNPGGTTVAPESNNQSEPNNSPSVNNEEGFNNQGSDANEIRRTTATPFPNPNLPYDPNLTPRQNLNQEGGSQQ